MIKKGNQVPPNAEPLGAYAIYEFQLSDLEGRLLTQIEAFGLPEKQESAAKSLVRQEVWKMISPFYRWVEGKDVPEPTQS